MRVTIELQDSIGVTCSVESNSVTLDDALILVQNALIGVGFYFAIKMYVVQRRKSIENSIGGGICMECGSKVFNKKCPNCDYSQG